MSNNIFMGGQYKSGAFLALSAAESEPPPEAGSEFVDFLHLQLDAAVSAVQVDVPELLAPAGGTAPLLQQPFSNALNVEVVVAAEEAADFGLLANPTLLLEQLRVGSHIVGHQLEGWLLQPDELFL
jgi:hypothetical protein